jgi:hypothetical protein
MYSPFVPYVYKASPLLPSDKFFVAAFPDKKVIISSNKYWLAKLKEVFLNLPASPRIQCIFFLFPGCINPEMFITVSADCGVQYSSHKINLHHNYSQLQLWITTRAWNTGYKARLKGQCLYMPVYACTETG